jgi:hypothetical protein
MESAFELSRCPCQINSVISLCVTSVTIQKGGFENDIRTRKHDWFWDGYRGWRDCGNRRFGFETS